MTAATPDTFAILIVDDDVSIRHDLTLALASSSRVIVQAESGQTAYSTIKHHPIHLVICDIQMPRGNGVWLLERLLAENIKPMFFCFYSALFNGSTIRQHPLGVDHVFAKCGDVDQLIAWVEESQSLVAKNLKVRT